MFAAPYTCADLADWPSPALIFYADFIEHNLRHALQMAGQPERLRLHVKTHKSADVVRLALQLGLTKHKCATLAEANMLATAGATDVLIAYPLVGPNVDRLLTLLARHPHTRWVVLVDHADAARALSAAVSAAGRVLDVFLDLDVGMHRTGVTVGPAALTLADVVAGLSGLRLCGLQAYDGHVQMPAASTRAGVVAELLEPVLHLRAELARRGHAIATLVCGGTPTFPYFAASTLPGIECSPGTIVLHDSNYGTRFPDLADFVPAALLLTRVVSQPAVNRLTFDLGHKAVAADPPAGQRLRLLGVPDAVAVMHSEEHLVVETPAADQFALGRAVLAVPAHVCPTCALHESALVVRGGRVVGTWPITARNRGIEPRLIP
jgi:D-serine deaminase-like pyridoxal phosphate-dependent protein